MKKCKNLVSVYKTLKNLSKTTLQNSQILYTNSPWVCLNKVCSNGGTTYIISKIIVKDNLSIANLMQTIENLLQNYITEFLDIAQKLKFV